MIRGVSLSCLSLIFVSVLCLSNAQTLQEAKIKFDAGDFAGAAQAYILVRNSGAAFERPEAAAFVIKSFREAIDHASVQRELEASRQTASGSPFLAEVEFEYAKSVQLNAKDTTTALQLYANVLVSYPDNVFAGSGALLQRGTIELDTLKTPTAAYATFEDLISRYPSSPFVDDALVAEATAAVSMADQGVLDGALTRLHQMNAAPRMLQKAQFQVGEFESKICRDRPHAIDAYMRTYKDYAIQSESAALAKIRAADLVPGGYFDRAIKLYQEVLRDYPRLAANLREWCLCQIAIYKYQISDQEGARADFESLLAANPGPKIRTAAQLHLAGFASPDSVEATIIAYDRGIRYHQTGKGYDETFLETQQVLLNSRKPFFTDYVSNASINKEERAQMLYRVVFGYFFGGRCGEALDTIARIENEIAPEGITHDECRYMKAFLLGRGGEWREAATLWRELIDSDPRSDLIPGALAELSRAQQFSGDTLGSILTLQELIARYPCHIKAKQAGQTIEMRLLNSPDLRPAFEEQKPAISAKWKGKQPPGRGTPPRENNNQIADLLDQITGGAQ